MHKVVSMAQLYPVIEEKLRAGGQIALTTTGDSMLPMLHHQQDTIVLGPVSVNPNIGDVVLYRRENGIYVLHRIVGRENNNDYIFCGDNQYILEHHINRQQIVGFLQAFTHKGCLIPCNAIRYKFYVYLLPVLRRIRKGLHWLRTHISSLKHKYNVY